MRWRKSSRCGTSACVEVLAEAGAVYVRDTAGAVVAFDRPAWQRFINQIKEGRLCRAR